MRLIFILAIMWTGCAEHEVREEEKVVASLQPTHGGGNGGGDDGGEGGDDGNQPDPRCPGDDTPVCNLEEAVKAFTVNIQPSIDKTCHLCHASGAGGLTMVKSDVEGGIAENRSQLKFHAPSNSSDFFLKISNQTQEGHGGGDQSLADKGHLTLSKIKAWTAAEVGCD